MAWKIWTPGLSCSIRRSSEPLTDSFAARWQVLQAARPTSSRLLAVSKGHPAASVRCVAELGQCDFGESRIQEALPKQEQLADLGDDLVDLDYGLRLRAKGYRSVVLSQYHFFQRDPFSAQNTNSAEGRSSDLARQRFFQKWSAELPKYDPFYSPNLRFAGNCAKFQLDVELPEETLASS